MFFTELRSFFCTIDLNFCCNFDQHSHEIVANDAIENSFLSNLDFWLNPTPFKLFVHFWKLQREILIMASKSSDEIPNEIVAGSLKSEAFENRDEVKVKQGDVDGK